MQKMVGSIIIIFACAGLGFEKSNEMKQHLQQLEELKKIFTFFRSELKYNKITFSELFYKLSRKTEGIFQEWLSALSKNLEQRQDGTFQKIWSQSVMSLEKNSNLKKEEIEELNSLGTSLGYVESIDLYLEQLDLKIQKTREELFSNKKLYQSMGILGGIFLVMVLL